MKKIVITGATGFLGRNLVEALLHNTKENFEIYALVRASSDASSLDQQQIKIVTYNNSYDSLHQLFAENKIDLTINLATHYVFDHKPADINQLVESNLQFGLNLLEAATANGCLNFVNTSSYIQNYFSREFYPSCLYAVTKQALEDAISYYATNKNLQAITLKLFDVYGAKDRRKKIVNLFQESQINNTVLKMSPGNQELRLNHISDVLAAIFTAQEMLQNINAQHLIYYVGGEPVTVRQLAKIFEEVSEKPLKIEWGALPYRNNQPLQSYIGEVLPNWKSKVSLEDGIKEILGKK